MRIKSVVKLHTANRFTFFGMPFMIAGIAFAIILTVGIFANVVTGGQDLEDMYMGMTWNGAIFALLGPLMGFGITSMTQYFPLATGLGLTRWEFARGTGLIFIANAAMFSVFVTLGKIIEEATSGWGLQVRFFNVFYTGIGPAWQTLVQTFLLILAFMFIGAAAATAVNRWGQMALWAGLLVMLVVILVAGMTAFINEEFLAWLISLLSMGWLPWMGVLLTVGVVSAVAWMTLVRRAQAR
ncbi:hypothetical protein [Paramicrobacterium agarici]|uniref:hypothetical protein n=1 Tax=Paramicrobacterium agarici TaxID=630514 RepID=UPI00115409E7|nr:hypothetical protein [Microbacterium agarici]TQO23132.1 hypothetical protein FB385_1978 [Microbacterium agarici]